MSHPTEETVVADVVGRRGFVHLGAATCPERDVMLRVWRENGELLNYELTPAAALELAEQLRRIAKAVQTRRVR